MHDAMVLVRHGQTEWSRTGRHTGRTDLALEPEGRHQAAGLAGLLGSWSFAQVLVSPLRRATETAELAGLGAVAELEPDLMEWDYGSYEGMTTAEIRAGRPDWDLWRHGVEGGEAAAEVGRRADRVIARARAVEGTTVCVAHGHLLRVLAARWVGLPPFGGRLLVLAPAAVGALGYERATPVVTAWNLTAPPR